MGEGENINEKGGQREEERTRKARRDMNKRKKK